MTKRKTVLAAAAGLVSTGALSAALLAAAPAPAQVAGPTDNSRTCFRVRDIDSVTVAHKATSDGREGVNLKVRNKDAYQLTLFGPCNQLDDSIRIGVESQNATGYICSGPEARVVVNGQITGRGVCQVDTVHKLTASELAALPAAERP